MSTSPNFYNIHHWGHGYFSVNSQGKIQVGLKSEKNGVELQTIVEAAKSAGLHLPLLIRFTDILQDRVSRLYEAFNQMRQEIKYSGLYQFIYPIKVNQEQSVVRELLRTPNHAIGLETSSKAELMEAIGLFEQPSTLVCNGYKDLNYIRIALIAQKMGHKVFIVIERLAEWPLILKQAERLNVRPCLGVRLRLNAQSSGKWESSGGARSKFGLNAAQILTLIEELKAKKALDCLQLIHSHLGSQIADIQDIRTGMEEISRYYVELRALGVPIDFVDVGGGLAVDYEGLHSNSSGSVNYSLKEYADCILSELKRFCARAEVPEPFLMSESGRAMTAHHAVLVTNVSDIEEVQSANIPEAVGHLPIFREMWQIYQGLEAMSPAKAYHHSTYLLHQSEDFFKHGIIDLQIKAKLETLYLDLCLAIFPRLDLHKPSEKQILAAIEDILAAKIFCNASFFQSLPDAWAIGQIFPVAPLSKLNSKHTLNSKLHDLTCDSDGTLKQYIGDYSSQTTLALPPYQPFEPYLLGFFLVGAYQEILGNLHNLFGDTNSISVKLVGSKGFEIRDLAGGDAVSDVLQFAHLEIKKLIQSYERQLIQAKLPKEEISFCLNELSNVFTQQTYLEDD